MTSAKNVLAFIMALIVPLQVVAKGPPARGVVLTDANGVEIGRVIGMERVSFPYVLTDEGYRTALNLGMGTNENPASVRIVREVLYYENVDCPKEEVAYFEPPMNVGTVFFPTNDFDYAYAQGLLMYSPLGSTLVEDVQVRSMLVWGACDNVESFSIDGYPAYLNDPAVTGISNTPYPSRLILK